MIRIDGSCSYGCCGSGVVSWLRSDGERIATPRPRAYPRIGSRSSQTTAVAALLPVGLRCQQPCRGSLGGSGDNRWLRSYILIMVAQRLHLTFTVSDDPTLCRRTALSGSL